MEVILRGYHAGGEGHHEGDRASMVGAQAQIDAAPGPFPPLRPFLIRFHLFAEDVRRATEGVEVIEDWEDARSTEKGDGRESVPKWCAVVRLVGEANSEWPHTWLDRVRPVVLGVHKHGAGAVLEIANAPLGNAVLEVGIDATVSDALAEGARMGEKEVFSEAPVVPMVVVDGDADAGGECFESLLGEECVRSVGGRLRVNEGEPC